MVKYAKIPLALTPYPLYTRHARTALHSWDEVGACGASCGAIMFTLRHAAHATRVISHTAISRLAISMCGTTFHTPLRMLRRRLQFCCSFSLLSILTRQI